MRITTVKLPLRFERCGGVSRLEQKQKQEQEQEQKQEQEQE